MRSDSFIGLFRALPHGKWLVTFPDLPGREAQGSTFKEVFHAAREALAERLAELEGPWPRPRSSAELLIDAQRDRRLCREFVDAVMHPVKPASDEERAPIELVALRASGSGHPDPQIGA